jgi:hypothetical protein
VVASQVYIMAYDRDAVVETLFSLLTLLDFGHADDDDGAFNNDDTTNGEQP